MLRVLWFHNHIMSESNPDFVLEFTFAEIAASSTLKDVLSDMKEQIDVVENFKSEIIDFR